MVNKRSQNINRISPDNEKDITLPENIFDLRKEWNNLKKSSKELIFIKKKELINIEDTIDIYENYNNFYTSLYVFILLFIFGLIAFKIFPNISDYLTYTSNYILYYANFRSILAHGFWSVMLYIVLFITIVIFIIMVSRLDFPKRRKKSQISVDNSLKGIFTLMLLCSFFVLLFSTLYGFHIVSKAFILSFINIINWIAAIWLYITFVTQVLNVLIDLYPKDNLKDLKTIRAVVIKDLIIALKILDEYIRGVHNHYEIYSIIEKKVNSISTKIACIPKLYLQNDSTKSTIVKKYANIEKNFRSLKYLVYFPNEKNIKDLRNIMIKSLNIFLKESYADLEIDKYYKDIDIQINAPINKSKVMMQRSLFVLWIIIPIISYFIFFKDIKSELNIGNHLFEMYILWCAIAFTLFPLKGIKLTFLDLMKELLHQIKQ